MPGEVEKGDISPFMIVACQDPHSGSCRNCRDQLIFAALDQIREMEDWEMSLRTTAHRSKSAGITKGRCVSES